MWRRPNLKGKLAMHGVIVISLLMLDIFRFRMPPNKCLWQRQTEHASFLQRFINRCTIVATIQGKWRPCGETDDSEYKSEVNRGFLKMVSAFANFNGGRIVFGVSVLTDDVMRTLGLLDGDTPTKAAAMLADENAFPGVDMARFGADRDTILDRETVKGVSVLTQFDRSMAFFERYCEYESIDGATRVLVERNPKKAFREAVANALAHCTWDVDACVGISLSEDGAEVVSPGGLVPGMTKEAYLEGRFSLLRNPVLAESMFRAGLIEKFGTGVRRIRSAYEGTGSSPSSEAGDGYVSVRPPFVDRRCALTDEERSVLDAVPENRLVSRSTVSEVTGYEKTKTVRRLNSLVAKGYLRQEGGRPRKKICLRGLGLSESGQLALVLVLMSLE